MATTMPVHQITVKDRKRKDYGDDLPELADSIAKYGVLEPLVVGPDGELKAGGRRLKAAQMAGLTEVPVIVSEVAGDIVEHEENERRRPFSPSEKAAAASAMRKAIADGKVAVPIGTRATDYVAELAGFDSGTTMRRVEAVVEKGVPELVAAMDKGEVSVGAAAEVAELPPAEQKKAVKSGTVKEKAAEVRKAKEEAKPAGKKKDKPEPVSEAKDGDDDDSEQLDGLGNPIPDIVADTFGDRDLTETIAVVKSLHADAVKLSELLKGRIAKKCGEFWRFAKSGEALAAVLDARDKLAAAFHQLEDGVPFCVCPHCDGKGCSQCRQSGYWPKWRYENRDQYGG